MVALPRIGKQERSRLELDFRLAVEPSYLSGALPKLNVVAVHELFCFFHSFGIIGALKLQGAVEMPICIDDVSAVVWHGGLLPISGESATGVLITDKATIRAVMGTSLSRRRPDMAINTDHLSGKLTEVK
jgi:hypothetical protein